MKALFVVVLSIINCGAFGQMKIGNITVSDSIGKKYLLDCYLRPDTVKLKRMWEEKYSMFPDGFSFSREEENYEKNNVESFNSHVKSVAIDEIVDTVTMGGYMDTTFNDGTGRYWFFGDTEEMRKIR